MCRECRERFQRRRLQRKPCQACITACTPRTCRDKCRYHLTAKCSRHCPRMCNPQLYVSGKRPIQCNQLFGHSIKLCVRNHAHTHTHTYIYTYIYITIRVRKRIMYRTLHEFAHDARALLCFDTLCMIPRMYAHFEGILPKGPYPPCLRMSDRALLAGFILMVGDDGCLVGWLLNLQSK